MSENRCKKEAIWVRRQGCKRCIRSFFTNCLLAHCMTKFLRFHITQYHTTPHHAASCCTTPCHVNMISSLSRIHSLSSLRILLKKYGTTFHVFILNYFKPYLRFILFCKNTLRYFLDVLTPIKFLLNIIYSISFFDK